MRRAGTSRIVGVAILVLAVDLWIPRATDTPCGIANTTEWLACTPLQDLARGACALLCVVTGLAMIHAREG